MNTKGSVKPPVLITLAVAAVTALLITYNSRTGRDGGPVGAAGPVAAAGAPEALDTMTATSPVLPAPRGETEPPVGQFVYLIDVSASTKDASAQSAFGEGVKVLQPTFAALRSLEEVTPQRHRVATIGAMSLRPAPRCDIYVPRQTLFTTSDSGQAVRTMRACEHVLSALPAEQYTDISGALVNAAISIQGARPALRGIVLVTDLDEDSPPGTVPGQPDLHGICVSIYTLVTNDAARNPRLMAERADSWRAKLLGWGARAVYTASVRGFDSADLAHFFRSCEGR